MNPTVKAQQVINRLAERSIGTSRQPVKCRLGSEPLRRRGKACSACPVRPEFELDQAVAELINAGVFKGTGTCPYQVITSHVVAGLIFSPEAIRAKSAGQYRVDPVVEIKGALKRIRAITQATRWSREDIEGLSNKDACWRLLGRFLPPSTRYRGPCRYSNRRPLAGHVDGPERCTYKPWRAPWRMLGAF